MVKALDEGQTEGMDETSWKELEAKVVSSIKLCLANDMLYRIMDEDSPVEVDVKFEEKDKALTLLNSLPVSHISSCTADPIDVSSASASDDGSDDKDSMDGCEDDDKEGMEKEYGSEEEEEEEEEEEDESSR
ncbi:histone chaperone RTT106-like [Malania oleifera]|uniref:histone chaperone RTT106-like n=1 Tax=Malania oleifera TaxID=397392 RepID=UPI0025ADE2D1|nr:histone chaperone RTT106-like [Malania oleifera]